MIDQFFSWFGTWAIKQLAVLRYKIKAATFSVAGKMCPVRHWFLHLAQSVSGFVFDPRWCESSLCCNNLMVFYLLAFLHLLAFLLFAHLRFFSFFSLTSCLLQLSIKVGSLILLNLHVKLFWQFPTWRCKMPHALKDAPSSALMLPGARLRNFANPKFSAQPQAENILPGCCTTFAVLTIDSEDWCACMRARPEA